MEMIGTQCVLLPSIQHFSMRPRLRAKWASSRSPGTSSEMMFVRPCVIHGDINTLANSADPIVRFSCEHRHSNRANYTRPHTCVAKCCYQFVNKNRRMQNKMERMNSAGPAVQGARHTDTRNECVRWSSFIWPLIGAHEQVHKSMTRHVAHFHSNICTTPTVCMICNAEQQIRAKPPCRKCLTRIGESTWRSDTQTSVPARSPAWCLRIATRANGAKPGRRINGAMTEKCDAYLPVWSLVCCWTWDNCLNRLSQYEHLYGFSPVWTRMCCTNWWLDEKLFIHCWHWCGLISPLRIPEKRENGKIETNQYRRRSMQLSTGAYLVPIIAGMLLILFGLIAAASPPLPFVELFTPEPRCRSRACCICIALLCMNIYMDGVRNTRNGREHGENEAMPKLL